MQEAGGIVTDLDGNENWLESGDILAANPFYGDLLETLKVAVPRPATVTGMKYNEVSAAFWNATHEVLSGKATGADSVKKLEGKISAIRRGPNW